MLYFAATPRWMQYLWPKYVWSMPASGKKLYLTFDDGPDETATSFVLDELEKHNAKATFFCVGSNVARNPRLYQRIIQEGHSTGNHTHRHLNGWKTGTREYVDDVREAAKHISSTLFRPPYGRVRKSQVRQLQDAMGVMPKIVMWSVLSADFDYNKRPDQCFEYVRKYARPGSIIVFHDSQKSWRNMSAALPQTLSYFSEKGYQFDRI